MSEKHYVVQGATCKCKFSEDSSKTDKIKVKTQTKHFGNDKEGSDKLLATTKEIGQTLEKNTFGNCKKTTYRQLVCTLSGRNNKVERSL